MENNTELVDFVVTARKYKTLLTNKYRNRQIWRQPVLGEVISNLPGTITRLEVKEGDVVKAGDLLMIHEAMKMYNRIVAPVGGRIEKVNVSEGERISKNHLMVKINPR